ncbi:inositol hexakisphosphate kinase (macronuclear) [Tetrahymena thermophila SB210]|uniref:Kinase n=1 Tax=Tetrahymena thermophila (strain SB210) TaxID=312017 RepID=Q22C70_TETTS|nr:inositol hexakisphosphate kinase [Tetrahymena thermophila SB210]EAR82886.2 inositol hexakisphosphate kinase [Tetrahymena thermophila SB210]|eukprot:XP_001030549.2 inositol hexakisphosphate kinase [Tetrahymena thermophila SB210]
MMSALIQTNECLLNSSKNQNISQKIETSGNSQTQASPSQHFKEEANELTEQQLCPSPTLVKADRFYLYLNQVGGHSTFLKPVDDRINFIAKPVQSKELEFYESIMKTKNLNKLKKFLPKYYGTVEINNSTQIVISNKKRISDMTSSQNQYNLNFDSKSQWLQSLFSKRFKYGKYMKLQDLTKNKKFPCILDIKMGFKATNQKDENKFQNSTSSSVGFRICGMNVYQPLKKCAIFKDKYWGRQIQQQSLESSVASFFFDGEQIRFGLIHMFIKQLKKLKRALQYYKGYKFHSSSLLLIYDGIYNAEQFKSQEKPSSKKIQIQDFPQNKSFNHSLNSTFIDQMSNFFTQKIVKKQKKLKEINQFQLEKISSDSQVKYKPLLLQNLKRRQSAYQYTFNSQQIQNYSDVEKKIISQHQSFNNQDNNIKIKCKQDSVENDLNQLDLIKITNQINLFSKARSQSSESNQSIISDKNQSIDNYSQEEEDNDVSSNQQSFSSFSSASSLNHSFMSQGSNANSKKNSSFDKKNNKSLLNKSYISSHSQECFSFKQSKPRPILKLIDFANIEINENVEEHDLELVKGIENFIELLMKIASKEVSQSFVIQNQQLFTSAEAEQQFKVINTLNNDFILEGIGFNQNNIQNQENLTNKN